VSTWFPSPGERVMTPSTSRMSARPGAIPGAFFWGWMADRIGRRKVFVATVLNFSLATGLMAASPDQYGWLFLAFCRMLVGVGVAGMVTVDLPLVQEFVPSSKRGWVGGLVTTTVSVGGALWKIARAKTSAGLRKR
jgi:putative MFS transporter